MSFFNFMLNPKQSGVEFVGFSVRCDDCRLEVHPSKLKEVQNSKCSKCEHFFDRCAGCIIMCKYKKQDLSICPECHRHSPQKAPVLMPVLPLSFFHNTGKDDVKKHDDNDDKQMGSDHETQQAQPIDRLKGALSKIEEKVKELRTNVDEYIST